MPWYYLSIRSLAGLGLNGQGQLDDTDLGQGLSRRRNNNETEHQALPLHPQRQGVKPAMHGAEVEPLVSGLKLLGRDPLPGNAIEEIAFEDFPLDPDDPDPPPLPELVGEPFALQWLGSLVGPKCS